MKLEIALIAAVLAIIGNIPYMREVLRGRVKPHPYTWLVGTIVSLTVFFGQLAKGAGVGAIPTAASEIFTVIIFVLSLRYGFKKITSLDTLFLAVALGGLVPWFFTHDPTWSVVIAVTVDLVSFAPTIRKTWAAPRTEAPILYVMNVARHILMLVSLEAYNVATTLHSVAMITLNIAMSAVIFVRRRTRRG